MMFYLRKFTIGFSLIIAFISSVHAETVVLERSQDLTLNILVAKLYEKNPTYNVELAYQQQATANTDLANSLFAGSATVSLSHFNDVIGSSDGFQEWESGIEAPLWLPGQKQQQLQLSEYLLAEIPFYKQQVLLAMSAKIRDLIWQIAKAEATSKQAYQTWQLAKTLEQDVNIRVQEGDLAGTEGLLAKTHTLDMQSQYLLTNAKLAQSLAIYQQVSGEKNLPALFEEALSDKTQVEPSHPMLAFYDQKVSTLQAKQMLAHYEDATPPSISVGIRRERGDHSESFNHSLGLGISFTFDDTVYRQPAIANAAREIADLQVARQNLALELNENLVSFLQQLSLNRQQLLLNEEHIDATQRYLILQQRAFDLGELDLFTFLNSQKLATESLNRKQQLEVAIKQTIANINQALGIIL